MDESEVVERVAWLDAGRALGDVTEVLAGETQGVYTKGSVGSYVEGFFGVASNSDQRPDLAELGIEIKSVPLRARSGGLVAKERTFITSIDYAAMVQQQFVLSPLDIKTRRTLFVYYRWESGLPLSSFRIVGAQIHDRSLVEERALQVAHEHVRSMVAACRAHELSESQTRIVGAATKDSRARDIPQPCGPATARRRAFAYKAGFVTQLWRAHEGKQQLTLSVAVTTPEDLLTSVLRRLDRYIGRSARSIAADVGVTYSEKYKAYASAVTRQVLAGKRQGQAAELASLGVTVRTIRVQPATDRPLESVSFPAFEVEDFIAEDGDPKDFEESDLLEAVSSMVFVVLWAEPRSPVPDAVLRGAFAWQPTSEQLAVMADEYTRLRDAWLTSNPESGPGPADTRILHVRPHGRDKTDVVALPDGRAVTRSSFWLNQDFVRQLVRDNLS